MSNTIKEIFIDFFKEYPQFTIFSPGRIDLMGIHTDYNEGFVLASAIDRGTQIAISKRNDDKVTVYSKNIGMKSMFPLSDITPTDSNARWSNYVRGVFKYIIEKGFNVSGANIALSGNIPTGGGLSSSASLELGIGTAIKALNGLDISPVELAFIGKRAENEFVGVQTGIMDQFTCALGKKGYGLFIDCRSFDYKLVPIDMNEVKIVVFNTDKRRGLVDSEYDTRRKQCEEGAKILGVKALRDVSVEMFETCKSELEGDIRKRVEHVVYENDRVLKSVKALEEKDFVAFGKLMNEGHDSARDLYEVSCPELDTMVNISRAQEGVLSARLAGAGFGGCTVSIIKNDALKKVIPIICKEYKKQTGLNPEAYICSAEDGAHVVR